jgi:Domain of unknown function (DUF4270)
MLFKNSLLAILLILLYSCDNTESFSSDSDFIESDTRIIDVDTFAMRLTTFKYDSLISNGDRLLVGRYMDPYFGEVKSNSSIEFLPTSYNLSVAENVIFDSIVLNLKYDGYYYNDTLLTKTLEVRTMAKEIRLPNSQTDYYNTTTIPVNEQIIGQKTFKPRVGNDSLTVRLDQTFGQTIFNALRSQNVNDRDEFLNYLKGINIAPSSTENASIIGFLPSGSYIRMYYSFPDQASVESEYTDLTYASATKRFYNSMTGNRTGTLLEALAGQEDEISSSAMQNLGFIQSGLGIFAKVTFPTIRNIKDYNDGNGSIFKAKVKIKLDNRYYDKNYPLPDSLYVCTVDQNNDIINYNGVGYIDKTNKEINEVFLVADIDYFIQKTLADSNYLNYGLVFIPYDYSMSTDRLILNGENNSNYRSRLTLTYVIYD